MKKLFTWWGQVSVHNDYISEIGKENNFSRTPRQLDGERLEIVECFIVNEGECDILLFAQWAKSQNTGRDKVILTLCGRLEVYVYVWVGLGFFLSLLTSSYDAINMFFHVTAISATVNILPL